MSTNPRAKISELECGDIFLMGNIGYRLERVNSIAAQIRVLIGRPVLIPPLHQPGQTGCIRYRREGRQGRYFQTAYPERMVDPGCEVEVIQRRKSG